jgi:glycosyltransferase involved in cell wall biosynthesis
MLRISPRQCIDCTDNDPDEFLRKTYVLFLLIGSPWPFVLVMIEAIALWTLVIAYRYRSIPEVIEDGVMGSMIDRLEAAIRAAEHLPTLSRNHRRRLFELHFTMSHMAEDHLNTRRRTFTPSRTLPHRGGGRGGGRCYQGCIDGAQYLVFTSGPSRASSRL